MTTSLVVVPSIIFTPPWHPLLSTPSPPFCVRLVTMNCHPFPSYDRLRLSRAGQLRATPSPRNSLPFSIVYQLTSAPCSSSQVYNRLKEIQRVELKTLSHPASAQLSVSFLYGCRPVTTPRNMYIVVPECASGFSSFSMLLDLDCLVEARVEEAVAAFLACLGMLALCKTRRMCQGTPLVTLAYLACQANHPRQSCQ